MTAQQPRQHTLPADPPAAAVEEAGTASTSIYATTREGRRQAIVLLIGVATLWVFALWTLITLAEGGLSGVEWVSALLMLGIFLAAPVVAWALLEEANSRYTTGPKGISYASLWGVTLNYPWEELSLPAPGARRGRLARFFLGDEPEFDPQPAPEVDAEEPSEGEIDEDGTLMLRSATDRTSQIANPAARVLHRLAHGVHLPIYSGIENRGALLREIGARLDGSGVKRET